MKGGRLNNHRVVWIVRAADAYFGYELFIRPVRRHTLLGLESLVPTP